MFYNITYFRFFLKIDKPIVYYHPTKIPPQYDNSVFNYEEEGFGPVVKSHEALVEEVCDCMKNSCQIKGTYKKRADAFFAFSDHESCARIVSIMQNKMKEK